MAQKPTIFISHSHSDWRIAERFQDLIDRASGNGLDVARSSQKGSIKSGQNWREWIDDKVVRCDIAIIVLTPGSFRGRWVLWEAGAVAGVQHERLKGRQVDSGDPLARRVRVLRFALREGDLGPFASTQTCNGLDQQEMIAFVAELLEELPLDRTAVRRGLMSLETAVGAFIGGAQDDLRYTPIQHDEGVTQEWLARLDAARLRNDDRWIVAAKRWINVAFLGANSGDAHIKGEVIDFRIHTRIADAHRRLGEWEGVIEQLQLAAQLSPNDLVVLRDLGRAQRSLKRTSDLERTMQDMQVLDPEIFKKDREGVAMRCAYFSNLENWVAVTTLLSDADPAIVSQDPYLANWYAVATMKVRGATASAPLFVQLKELLERSGKGFWDDATMVNALLALDDPDVESKLRRLELPKRTNDEVESATRFYDDIVTVFRRSFDWRRIAGLTTSREAAGT
jgi:hypothetical protein